MIRAVIFDMDGVLIDTEKHLFHFWKEAAKEFGYELTTEHLLGIRSLAREFAIPHLQKAVSEDFPYDAVRSRRRELMNPFMEKNGVEMKAGADTFLDYLRAHGYKTAVATASDYERTKDYLSQIGLFDKFDQIVCAPDLPHGKPMPDVYLKACSEIGFDPACCLALEDSDNGALSAHRAGCHVVMVPDLAPPLKESLDFLDGVADGLMNVIPILEEWKA